MIQVYKAIERGVGGHGWLHSYHSFSFANFFDPQKMGFRVLRVINEDRINPGTGFDTHGHKDMEIISYVMKGELLHKDSIGNISIIKPGEIQRMSAGTGVFHSEYNNSKTEGAHFLQIWILPKESGTLPSYDQKNFNEKLSLSRLVLVASQDGKFNSVKINQDVNMYACKAITPGNHCLDLSKGRFAWIQVVNGTLYIEDVKLDSGDGASFIEHEILNLKWTSGSEFLVFDLP